MVVLVDSLTRLARAYQLSIGGGSRSGSADTAWVYPTKKLFGAARNVEGGGSLTMVATVVTDTGIAMDDVVASEVSGAATMELALSAEAAGARMFPAFDIARSGTRKEELILGSDQAVAVASLRQKLVGSPAVEGLQNLASKLAGTSSNVEALVALPKSL